MPDGKVLGKAGELFCVTQGTEWLRLPGLNS